MSKESCSCAVCVSACSRCPGMMSPDDARKAIDAGMSGRLMLDWRGGDDPFDGNNVFVLSAAVVGYEGEYAPYPDPDRGFVGVYLFGLNGIGRCNFLVNDRCSIHDSGFKPIECREALSCGRQSMSRDDIAKLWDTPEGKVTVEEWRNRHGWGDA